jgi:hypothetical protein
METSVPFAGFYATAHASAVGQNALYLYGCDNEEHSKPEWTSVQSCDPESCLSKATSLEYKNVEVAYCKMYVENFSNLVKIPLRYNAMESPREYNFRTDRIFAEISEEDVEKLKSLIDPVLIRAYVKKHFTSHDGFSSFYDSDYDKWLTQVDDDTRQEGCGYSQHYVGGCACPREPKPFDVNQIGALLECYAEQIDRDWESNVYEDTQGNF